MASNSIRIGNAHGFWGDRLEAAAELLACEPELDYLTLDFLAEVSMSILAAQRRRDDRLGYAADFVEVVRSLAPYWKAGGQCRVVANAGGLNPRACAEACRRALVEEGCPSMRIAAVSGDDVLRQVSRVESSLSRNLDTGEPIEKVADRLVTANAYLGARPITDALTRGARLVVTGRVADPSLVVGPCASHFTWSRDDWDRLAGATVAGHLIECGTQVTGGISTDWLELHGDQLPAFPLVEVAEDGSCLVSKAGAGGGVTEATVREQLLYEIGDPDCYLSPDVEVSFLELQVQSESADRVRVSGARGRPAPSTRKVSATWQRGFRASGQLTIYGSNAVDKARRAGAALLARLERDEGAFEESLVEVVGAGACDPRRRNGRADSDTPHEGPAADEVTLRISVADPSRERVERFSRSLMSLITAGPPGVTGYADGRPRVHPAIAYWPCLIEAESVEAKVELLEYGEGSETQRGSSGVRPSGDERGERDPSSGRRDGEANEVDGRRIRPPANAGHSLESIALARSGDKGRHANIGVLARRDADFPRLRRGLTAAVVARWLGIADVSRVERFELPNLSAFNFVVHDLLDSSLRVDAQGKALGQVLLAMPLAVLDGDESGKGDDFPQEEAVT